MIGIRQLSLVALSLFALSSTWARAGSDFIDLRDMQALEGNAEAGKERAAACMACHGSAGISPVPLFPNLAGQHAEYMYGRLLQIKREARAESPMTAMVADLDDTAMRDLSVWFASLAAPATAPAAQTSGDTDESGRRLYMEGDSARGVPPCQGCHGAAGQGYPLAAASPRWRVIPKLGAQHAQYLAQRLSDYRDGKHMEASSARLMTPIAATLDDTDIAALTQWMASADFQNMCLTQSPETSNSEESCPD